MNSDLKYFYGNLDKLLENEPELKNVFQSLKTQLSQSQTLNQEIENLLPSSNNLNLNPHPLNPNFLSQPETQVKDIETLLSQGENNNLLIDRIDELKRNCREFHKMEDKLK